MKLHPSILRRFSFFQPLDDAELARVAPHIREKRYPAGALIFKDGEPGDKFYLVRSGRVLIYKPTPEGDTPLNEMRVGDGFGEMSLLDDLPRSAAARAVGDATLLEISRDRFISLVQNFPALLIQAVRDNAERLRHSNTQWIRELETRNRQLEKLYETSLAISRHLELQTALVNISERARQLLDGEAGALYLHDPTSNRLVPQVPGPAIRLGHGIIGRAYGCVEPLYENRTARRGSTAHSTLAAPICLDTQPVGVLAVYRPAAGAPFTPQDAQLLLLLANQAAIAVENARLHQTAIDKARLDGELQAAYKVQHSLLPLHVPHIPGFQVAALWRPARQVSGDFYDFIPLPDKRWGIVIADVSDKGIPAALLMAASRSILRASATSGLDAVATIVQTNRVLSADATNGMFITLFFALLDPHTRTLSYVNAGHNPPLLLRARDGRLEPLTRTTFPLGIDADAPVRAGVVQLDPGDVLTLYTDGVTEAANPALEFLGETGLADLITSVGPSGAQALVRALDKRISEFTGTATLADDVTVVVLQAHKRQA
ncbi:MAG: SpoIIE family protein phosphatase [Anaerolineae bacterium]